MAIGKRTLVEADAELESYKAGRVRRHIIAGMVARDGSRYTGEYSVEDGVVWFRVTDGKGLESETTERPVEVLDLTVDFGKRVNMKGERA